MQRLYRPLRRLGTFLPVLVLACDSVAVTPPGVTRIEVSPATIELEVGETTQLRATALGASGANLPLGSAVWTTSDAGIVQVDGSGRITGLAVGVAAVTVTAAGTAASAAVSVRAPGALALVLSDTLLTFETDLGAADPAPASVAIGGVGTDLSAQVVHAAGQPFGWLLASLTSSSTPADLRVEVRAAGLAVGLYDAEVRVVDRASGDLARLVVRLSVLDPNPVIDVATDTVRLQDTDQATLTIRNGGGGTLSGLSARVRYVGTAGTWLQTTLSGSVAPTTLTVTSIPTGLPAGTYHGFVDVASSLGGVGTRTVPVRLQVGGVASSLVVTPKRLDLSALVGAAPATAQVRVDHSGVGAVTGLTKAVSYAPNQPTGWLDAVLDRTTTPATLAVEASPGALAIGTYTASIEVAGSGVAALLLPVTLTVDVAPPAAPAAPSGLGATAPTATAVGLAWTDNSANETAFEIERASSGGAFAALATVATDVVTYTDAAVAPGTAYDYRVRACNAAGCSSWSATASVVTPGSLPAAPSGLTAAASGSSIVDLKWTDNSANETAFEIERADAGGTFAALASVAANLTDYADATVTSGSAYDYRVRACNAAGCSAWSATASVLVPAPTPPAPASLGATVLSAIDIDLTWPDVAGETSYELEIQGATGGFQPLAVVGANTTNYRAATLAPGTRYRFQVRSCNAAGCSAWTGSAQVQTQSPTSAPSDPSGLVFVSLSASQIVLSWNDNSNDETRFVIEEGDLLGPWIAIGEVGVNETTFTDTAVRRRLLIFYRVRACNPVGCSSPSVPVSVVIP